MIQLFQSSNWIVQALLVIIPVILISLGLLILLRNTVNIETLRANHDVAGFTFGIIGVLYSVVLGFTVVDTNDRFNQAEQNISTEAFAIADLYRDASFFPPKESADIRSCLREYVHYVLTEEWGHPIKRQIRIESQDIIEKLWKIYYRVELPSDKAEIWYTSSISKLNTFTDASLARQLSQWNQLGPMMWSLLVLGGFITICFMFFFGLESFRSQMVMTILLAGYISFMLFLVYNLDHIFEQPGATDPVALEQLEVLFDRWDR